MDGHEERTLVAFCGHCVHFEFWPLGGGADCGRGHDTQARARTSHCADRHLTAHTEGPLFDLSE